MTLKQIIYNIQNLAKAGGIVDDNRLSNRQVGFWVNYYRALLIRRDLDKKATTFSDNIIQDLGCVELEQVDSAECCVAPIGCYILKSKLALPKPLELSEMDAITFVGSLDSTRGYELSSSVRSNWDQYNRYTSKTPKAYFTGGHIYVTIDEAIRFIRVLGLFEDPTEASRFHHCDGDACYTEDSEYPISAWMIAPITEMILQKELNITISTSSDTTNNAQDDAEQKRKA